MARRSSNSAYIVAGRESLRTRRGRLGAARPTRPSSPWGPGITHSPGVLSALHGPVEALGECRLWLGNPEGEPVMDVGGWMTPVQVVAAEEFSGKRLAVHAEVVSKCGSRRCINPAHLRTQRVGEGLGAERTPARRGSAGSPPASSGITGIVWNAKRSVWVATVVRNGSATQLASDIRLAVAYRKRKAILGGGWPIKPEMERWAEFLCSLEDDGTPFTPEDVEKASAKFWRQT